MNWGGQIQNEENSCECPGYKFGFINRSSILPRLPDEIQSSTAPMKWPQKSCHDPEMWKTPKVYSDH
jgi:hypothetical protein